MTVYVVLHFGTLSSVWSTKELAQHEVERLRKGETAEDKLFILWEEHTVYEAVR